MFSKRTGSLFFPGNFRFALWKGFRIVSVLFVSFFVGSISFGQTVGGNSVFNFLNLPNTPQLTALGGINISQPSNDVGLAFNNPALLRKEMHSQMNAVFNDYYAGVTAYHLSMGYHHSKLNTNFLWGLNFINYGTLQETDAAGNVLGKLRPTDWVMHLSASRKYLEKWHYGSTIKFISSNYGQYRSNGLAVDMGLVYSDTAKLFTASVVAKNMGFQLKKYAGTEPDDLPFDLQVGISKRLARAPFGFSVTAHHLHRFNLSYNDTVFNNSNGFDNNAGKKFSFDKIFRHFVLASTIYLGEKVEVTVGYNYLRRKELNIGGGGNGLNGFSLGAALILEKMQVRYARSHYQNGTGYNQLGLNLVLNKYFGLGKFGERVGW